MIMEVSNDDESDDDNDYYISSYSTCNINNYKSNEQQAQAQQVVRY